MNQPIRPLDPLIIAQIAAGEVVERPALALKELIENSLDAGATAITIAIEDGGLTQMRITDNGRGIEPSDIRMAFQRHATSKLQTQDQLTKIATLGFRGEALAAISAVSHVDLVSRALSQEHGTRVRVVGGRIEEILDAASPEGTSITVRDLFFNTPARLKFMKKPSQEAALVSEMVLRLILSRPDVSFRLESQHRTVYHSPGNGSLRDAMGALLGADIVAKLQRVKGTAAGCFVDGLIGVGECARGNRQVELFYLNGRAIDAPGLSQALESACRERVMIGRFPVCALHLTVSFDQVDVNVHPNKLTVRFQNEAAIAQGLAGLVQEALSTNAFQSAPDLVPQTSHKPSVDWNAVLPKIEPLEPKPLVVRDAVRGIAIPPKSEQTDIPLPLSSLAGQMVTVGVVFDAYILVEQGNTLFAIDQHAAHERILYDRFLGMLKAGGLSQPLLVPLALTLTQREQVVLLENLPSLGAIGFEIEDFGGNAIQVRAVPSLWGTEDIPQRITELAGMLLNGRAIGEPEARREAILRHACRLSVKAGDALPAESIRSLVHTLQTTHLAPTCPHGRPIVIQIERREFDRRFGRTS